MATPDSTWHLITSIYVGNCLCYLVPQTWSFYRVSPHFKAFFFFLNVDSRISIKWNEFGLNSGMKYLLRNVLICQGRSCIGSEHWNSITFNVMRYPYSTVGNITQEYPTESDRYLGSHSAECTRESCNGHLENNPMLWVSCLQSGSSTDLWSEECGFISFCTMIQSSARVGPDNCCCLSAKYLILLFYT